MSGGGGRAGSAWVPSEADFQRTVLELARLLGWRCAHFRPAQTRHGWRTAVAADGAGFPDLVLVRDRLLFAELKADGGRVSADQRAWLDALATAGQAVFVWRPADFPAIERELRAAAGGTERHARAGRRGDER